MHIRSVQDAQTSLSEVLDACVSEGPQVIARHGVETAVLAPIAEWQRLNHGIRPSPYFYLR
jgi:prevent-host-death family protein